MSENNKKQAMFPKEAQIIDNEYGTAPGAIYEKDGKKIIVMPGPPREMMPMFDNKIKPFLSKESDDVFVSRYVRFYGIGESNLETQLEDILDKQTNPTIALYAKSGEVLIRVTASGKDKEHCLKMIEKEIEKLKDRVGKYIYLIGDESISSSQSELEKVTAALLVEKKIKIATAESCTGGKVASMLIDYPGISDVFLEGLVTYSNEAKMRTLGVKEDTLKKHGAKDENILVKTVPGSFELTFGANQMMENCDLDAIIAIGCVIKGDTPHFDYVCMGATQGITELNATGDIPVIYGLITTNTMEQAEDRAGGKLGNKGDECAITAIKMIDFVWSLNK